jgi:splicing factor U2AF 35 kDa subunit
MATQVLSLRTTSLLLLQSFYEDVFEEMAKFGKIECLNVCDNYSDHLVGNVYVKFGTEQEALDAMTALQNRYYNGKQILAEFSPVADFREATCRQYEENSCQRGGFCNFMHLKPISRWGSGPESGILMMM